MAWKTASRWNDIETFQGSMSVKKAWAIEPTVAIILKWAWGTKTSQTKTGAGLVAPHLWTVIVPHQSGDDLQHFLALKQILLNLQPHQRLTLISTEQITRFLRMTNPHLTAHSIKRGAVSRLFDEGAELDLISRLAKHSAGVRTGFSQTTLGYGGNEAAIAIALRTHLVTRLL
jgi:hypothetical protein